MEYQLPTKLTFNNVNFELNRFKKFLANNKNIVCYLNDILNIDSAGIALLLEIKRLALINNCSLEYKNKCSVIERLCQLYQLKI